MWQSPQTNIDSENSQIGGEGSLSTPHMAPSVDD